MKKQYNISDFARRIGRSASTVRRWERDGLIKSKRLPSGHRYFDEDDVRGILGKADEKRLTVVYCRVSSHGQRDDLQSQVAAMEQYCLGAGIAVDEWVQETEVKVTRTIYADVPPQLAAVCKVGGYIRADIWRRYGALGNVGTSASAVRSAIVEKNIYDGLFIDGTIRAETTKDIVNDILTAAVAFFWTVG